VIAKINKKECSGCGQCYDICHAEAISKDLEDLEVRVAYKVDPERCEGCGVCESDCHKRAIKVE